MVFHSIWVISVTTGLGGGGQVISTAPWKCYPIEVHLMLHSRFSCRYNKCYRDLLWGGLRVTILTNSLHKMWIVSGISSMCTWSQSVVVHFRHKPPASQSYTRVQVSSRQTFGMDWTQMELDAFLLPGKTLMVFFSCVHGTVIFR